jgi:hypothetical protein
VSSEENYGDVVATSLRRFRRFERLSATNGITQDRIGQRFQLIACAVLGGRRSGQVRTVTPSQIYADENYSRRKYSSAHRDASIGIG